MPSALPTTAPASAAPTSLAPPQLANFRNPETPDSDNSDSDQSDASGRSLSPTRQGLSKTKKKKERRQFGAFADELGDLLGAAFQKDDQNPVGLAGSEHATNPPDTDLEMQQPPSTGPKMSRRARQNFEKAQARRLAKEQSSMVVEQPSAVAAERRGMTIVQGKKPEGITKGKGDATKRRRSRKEREKLKKKLGSLLEKGGEGGMEID